MSRYGSPEEPYESSRDDYGPPSDPWGHTAGAWSDAPTSALGGHPAGPPQPPAGYGPGYPPSGAAPQPPYPPSGAAPYPPHSAGPDPVVIRPATPPRPPRSRPVGLYLMVAALVLLAGAGVAYALFLLTGDDGEPLGGATASPSVDPTGTPPATPSPEATERNNLGMNAAMALVDDCLVNDGTMELPQMRIVPCDTDESGQVFQVLAIFDEEVEGEGETADKQAQEICADVDGYTHHYYEVGEAASFVLCLTELD